MREFFVLEYKNTDSRGREKNAQFAGIFTNMDDIEIAKERLLSKNNNKITFQVFNNRSIF
tara:strand:- start:1912 stop:2091 length:180 start_codon:yes stop_codon:yes gene_type:complete